MKSFAEAVKTQREMLDGMFEGQVSIAARLLLEGFTEDDVSEFGAYVIRLVDMTNFLTIQEILLNGTDPEEALIDATIKTSLITFLIGFDIGRSQAVPTTNG